MTLTLTIPAPCEPLNSNHRLHHHVKAKRTAAWRARAQVAAIQAGKPKLPRAHIKATVSITSRRAYDAGNWYPTAKACLDGIVSAGCLPDDSNEYVTGPDMRPGDKAGVFTIIMSLDPNCRCSDCVTTDTAPCPWCGTETEETGEHHACMVAHCIDCIGQCRHCQDDMASEADL